MIDKNASYQVIPSIPEVFSGNTWEIVLDLLPFSQYIFLYFTAILYSTYASLFRSSIGPVPSRTGLDFYCSIEESRGFELNQDPIGTDTVANSFDCLKKLLGIITNIRYPQTPSVSLASSI